MESNVKFEEILTCFLSENNSNYYFLLKNSILTAQNPLKETILELKEKQVIPIPRRTKEFDLKLKETFVYEITDVKIAEKLFEVKMGPINGITFDALIKELNLSEKWTSHVKKYSTNALINWLEKSDLLLPGQVLCEKINIQKANLTDVPSEMSTFAPLNCNSCSCDFGFVVSYFKTNTPCENLLMEKDAKEELTKLGFPEFHFLGSQKKELIAASSCPRCNGYDLNWDVK